MLRGLCLSWPKVPSGETSVQYRVVEWFPKDERNEEDGEAFKMGDTEPLLESLWQRESRSFP